jgi:hypothetical protein
MLYTYQFGKVGFLNIKPEYIVEDASGYLSSVLNSYNDDNVFRTMLLFIIKYSAKYEHIYELLETNYENLALKGHTFEIIDKYTEEAFEIIIKSKLEEDENYDYEEDEDDDPDYGKYVLNKMVRYQKYVDIYNDHMSNVQFKIYNFELHTQRC